MNELILCLLETCLKVATNQRARRVHQGAKRIAASTRGKLNKALEICVKHFDTVIF